MIQIRAYEEQDIAPVTALFTAVNRQLTPTDQEAEFERYIERSLVEEISQIPKYYALRKGGFWVAYSGPSLVGMFGVEKLEDSVYELRRLYVDTGFRRQGIARILLEDAEEKSRALGAIDLALSTSELQKPAIKLYLNAGYELTSEEKVEKPSNKTIGGGIRRFHFRKRLK